MFRRKKLVKIIDTLIDSEIVYPYEKYADYENNVILVNPQSNCDGIVGYQIKYKYIKVSYKNENGEIFLEEYKNIYADRTLKKGDVLYLESNMNHTKVTLNFEVSNGILKQFENEQK